MYVGVPTESDSGKGFAALGVNGLDGGDPKADAEAMAADINRHGGLFGRQVKVVIYDFSYTSAAANATAAAQAGCAYFTEDHPVLAVVNPLVGNWDNPVFEACVTKHKTVLIEGPSTGPYDGTSLRQLGRYFYDTAVPTVDRAVTAMVPQLAKEGFFSGWDTTNGGPGKEPVKVGLLYDDGVTIRRVLPLIRSALAKSGHPVVTEFGIQSLNDGDAAVLRMRSAGVTHVISPDIFVLLMMLSAENQRYRPRYSVGTMQIPQFWMQQAPQAQLKGSMGIGWYPTADVAEQEDPGPVGPGQAACGKAMVAAGLSYSKRRTAEGASFAFCDAFNLLAIGARLGGGLDPISLTNGIAAVGRRLQVSAVFGNGLSPSYHMVPDTARTIFYDGSCGCFRYRGSLFPM